MIQALYLDETHTKEINYFLVVKDHTQLTDMVYSFYRTRLGQPDMGESGATISKQTVKWAHIWQSCHQGLV